MDYQKISQHFITSLCTSVLISSTMMASNELSKEEQGWGGYLYSWVPAAPWSSSTAAPSQLGQRGYPTEQTTLDPPIEEDLDVGGHQRPRSLSDTHITINIPIPISTSSMPSASPTFLYSHSLPPVTSAHLDPAASFIMLDPSLSLTTTPILPSQPRALPESAIIRPPAQHVDGPQRTFHHPDLPSFSTSNTHPDITGSFTNTNVRESLDSMGLGDTFFDSILPMTPTTSPASSCDLSSSLLETGRGSLTLERISSPLDIPCVSTSEPVTTSSQQNTPPALLFGGGMLLGGLAAMLVFKK